MHSSPSIKYKGKNIENIIDVDFNWETRSEKVESGGYIFNIENFDNKKIKNTGLHSIKQGFRSGKNIQSK